MPRWKFHKNGNLRFAQHLGQMVVGKAGTNTNFLRMRNDILVKMWLLLAFNPRAVQ